MGNMLLATPLLSDAAALSGSPHSGALPIGNLKTASLKEVYRPATASGVYIVADLGAAKAVNLVSLIGHTGSSRAYARVRAANTLVGLTSAPGYDSGTLPFRSHQSGYDAAWAASVGDEQAGALDRNLFLIQLPAQSFQFWRIDITDPMAAYLDIGRLYIAKAWQPAYNMDYGLAEGWIDPSRKSRTVSGEVVPLERKKYRFAELTLSYGSQEEMYSNAFEIERQRGLTRDVLWVFDPAAGVHLQRRTIYGTLAALNPIVNTAFGLFQKTLRIEEIPA